MAVYGCNIFLSYQWQNCNKIIIKFYVRLCRYITLLKSLKSVICASIEALSEAFTKASSRRVRYSAPTSATGTSCCTVAAYQVDTWLRNRWHSSGFRDFLNNTDLASSVVFTSPALYKLQINFSQLSMVISLSSGFLWKTVSAVLLLCPARYDVVSDHVRAWKGKRASAVLGWKPLALMMALMDMNFWLLHVPSFVMICLLIVVACATSKSNSPVSVDHTTIFWDGVCLHCTTIRGSTSLSVLLIPEKKSGLLVDNDMLWKQKVWRKSLK